MKEKLGKLYNFMDKNIYPALRNEAAPIAKDILYNLMDAEKKKELIIKRVKTMSEEKLDEIIKENHPLGFIGVHFYDRVKKLQIIIDAINDMDEHELNQLISQQIRKIVSL